MWVDGPSETLFSEMPSCMKSFGAEGSLTYHWSATCIFLCLPACMCKFLMHKLVIYMHEHNHGTHLAAHTNTFFTFLLPLAWHVPLSAHRVLTGCSLGAHLGAHLVLTWCSLGAHWVLIGCSLGAHWVLIDPTWQPGHDASTDLHHSSQQ